MNDLINSDDSIQAAVVSPILNLTSKWDTVIPFKEYLGGCLDQVSLSAAYQLILYYRK